MKKMLSQAEEYLYEYLYAKQTSQNLHTRPESTVHFSTNLKESRYLLANMYNAFILRFSASSSKIGYATGITWTFAAAEAYL